MATPRPSTSYSYASTSYQNGYTTSTPQAPDMFRSGTSRPGTARPSSRRSRASSALGGESQQIICAVNESRGVSPTVGLSFVNITTGEAVLSQICDNQFYARTLNKLQVFEPTVILIISTCGPPNPSKMYLVIEENILGARIIMVDRKYWVESAGLEFIQQLAFVEDVEALKVAVEGNFFATCCFAAVSPFKSFLWCRLSFEGTKVYRLEHVSDICLSFSPYQISTIRGFDDDRPVHNSIFGAHSEHPECQVEGLPLWSDERGAHSNGFSLAQEQYITAFNTRDCSQAKV